MTHITNADVPGIIDRGGDVSGRNRNFWGEGSTRWTPYHNGYMPRQLAQNIYDFAKSRGGVTAVIYSYSTPVALKVGGVWIIPDISYSPTTSSKHQSQLYRLQANWVPRDVSVDELESIYGGYITYERYKNKYRRLGPVRARD